LISGIAIQLAFNTLYMRPALRKLLLGAKAVVVYRSSPGQKAEVVKFMKDASDNKIILAIGDGANDVNMIQQAHIGFGLKGKEGN
jgi:P-type E1-E2 ATPase